MKAQSSRKPDETFSIERREYESQLAQRFQTWQAEIQQLASKATGQDVPKSVGNDQIQVQKLQGQWEMAMVQFNELCSVNTIQAWEDLRAGLDEKAEEFEASLTRTHQQIERNRSAERQTGVT